MAQKHEELLRCMLTDEEKLAISQRLSKACSDKEELELRKKEVSASLKASIEEQSSMIARDSRILQNGYEYRNVECMVTFNMPESGRKSYYRRDTGAFVRSAEMTDADRQTAMDFDESA